MCANEILKMQRWLITRSTLNPISPALKEYCTSQQNTTDLSNRMNSYAYICLYADKLYNYWLMSACSYSYFQKFFLVRTSNPDWNFFLLSIIQWNVCDGSASSANKINADPSEVKLQNCFET